MTSQKVRRYNGARYRVWPGWTGKWFWQVVDSNHLDGEADSQREAGKAARAAIDRKSSHKPYVDRAPYNWKTR